MEAIPAVLMGIVLFLCLPDGPERASFLSAAERAALIKDVQAGRGSAAPAPAPGEGKEGGEGKEEASDGEVPAPVLVLETEPARPTLRDDWVATKVALKSKVCWYAGIWRFFYMLTRHACWGRCSGRCGSTCSSAPERGRPSQTGALAPGPPPALSPAATACRTSSFSS